LLGGTADITCHKVQNDGFLQELHPPTGGPWGGKSVDQSYYKFLEDLVGPDVWESFKANHLNDKLDMERSFETKKRNIKKSETVLKVGGGLLTTYENKHHIPLAQTIKPGSKFHGSVTITLDKLKVNNEILMEFFTKPLDAIVAHIKKLLSERKLRGIETLIMVGGFSDSPVTLETIKKSFPDLQVIRPPDAGLAVLKGAVLFGHSPSVICERSSPSTYGICTSIPWKGGIHPKRCFYVQNGAEVCTDVFQVMVCRGQPITMGKSVAKHMCKPAHETDDFATVEIYTSNHENPMYVFEPYGRHLGDIKVKVPQNLEQRFIEVTMHFGSTELRVSAEVIGTNHKAQVKFDFLH